MSPTDDSSPPQQPSAPIVPQGRIRRSLPVAGFAARTAGEGIVAALAARRGHPDRREEFHERTAERYVDLLGRSRGVLMKAGQLISAMDLSGLPSGPTFEVYRAAFERLQDDAPPMPAATARACIEAELGRPIDDVFASFGDEPLAAASIGQVHPATLPDGRSVAVKVQFPGVEAAMRADLANTELLATFLKLASSLAPGFAIDHRKVSAEITARISEELDYGHEAANLAAFGDLYRDHPFIHVPETVPEASSRRVLTMTRLTGRRWSDTGDAPQALKDQWGEVIYRFGIGSYRLSHLFNADPHPGNYLFRDDGTVGFVDFGCVRTFDRAELVVMHDYIRAVIEGDGDRLRQTMVDSGVLPATSATTGAELAEWSRQTLVSITAPQPYTFGPEYLTEISERYQPRGEWGSIVSQLDLPPSFVFTTRVDFGIHGVLCHLGATGEWRAILDELDGVGPPAGHFGAAQQAWWAQRAA